MSECIAVIHLLHSFLIGNKISNLSILQIVIHHQFFYLPLTSVVGGLFLALCFQGFPLSPKKCNCSLNGVYGFVLMCVHVFVHLQWVGTLSRVSLTLCLVSPWIGSRFFQIQDRCILCIVCDLFLSSCVSSCVYFYS